MVALMMTVSVGDVRANIQAPMIGNFSEPAPFPRQTRGPTRLILQKARKRSDMPVRNVIAYALACDGARMPDRVVGSGRAIKRSQQYSLNTDASEAVAMTPIGVL